MTGNVSFLENIIGKPNMILINNAKNIFFNSVILKKNPALNKTKLNAMKPTKKKKLISAINVKDWGIELKKPTNIFLVI